MPSSVASVGVEVVVRVITPSSYHSVPADRALADQVMRRLQLDPNDVSLIELGEGGVVYELLVRDGSGRWTGDRERVRA